MFAEWTLNELRDYSDRLYSLLDIVNEEVEKRELMVDRKLTLCPMCGALMVDDEDCLCYDED